MSGPGGQFDTTGPLAASLERLRRTALVAFAARLGVRLDPGRARTLLDQRGLPGAAASIQRLALLPRWLRLHLLAWSTRGDRR